jgi:hypothetical protein
MALLHKQCARARGRAVQRLLDASRAPWHPASHFSPLKTSLRPSAAILAGGSRLAPPSAALARSRAAALYATPHLERHLPKRIKLDAVRYASRAVQWL